MALLFHVSDIWLNFTFTVKMPGWIEFVRIRTVDVGVAVHRPTVLH